MPSFLSRVAPVEEEAPDTATHLVPLPWQNRAPLSFAELLRSHYAAIRAARAAAVGPGYLVVVIRGEDHFIGHGCVTLGDAEASHTLVVGRHARTDIHLAGDPTVAPRHLIVRVRLDSERRPILRVLDLHTEYGFLVDGVGSCSAAITEGEILVRIGTYALLFLPLRRDGMPWPDDPALILGSKSQVAPSDPRSLHGAWRAIQVGSPTASLRVLPGASLLGAPPMDAERAEVIATLTIEGSGSRAVYAIGAQQLDCGVLVGRYPCWDVGTSGFAHAGPIARAHLLILREGEDIFAIDVASTNGILINAVETRVERLAACCTIELGAGTIAHWKLHGDAASRQGASDPRLN